MNSNKLYFLFFCIIISNTIFCSPIIDEVESYCNKRNPLTNLCIKCKYDVLIPDNNGDCIGAEKCIFGKNYCQECGEEGKICKKCELGYYPDKNGGCSYTENCIISYNGNCIQCENNYILIGKEFDLKICKNINLDDFKHCKEIDKEKGVCILCEDEYYLNGLDKKCTKTEYCDESIYGICISCYIGYFLNKKNNTCLLKVGNFLYCKESLDGENCEKCDQITYLDESGSCALSNYCSKSLNGKCQKCISNYYLSSFNLVCSTEKYCIEADADTGLCISCESNYYLDTKDYKCKSNIEENDYKYCTYVINNQCTQCIPGYKISRDLKCTDTFYCSEVKNGKCISCENNYYLGKDNTCTNIEFCIYSDYNGNCLECQDGYYYNFQKKHCLKADGIFENCKISSMYGDYCHKCKKDFYLNRNTSICIDNMEKGPFYKCAESDKNNEFCIKCIENYFLGGWDNKCSLIDNCRISKDENTCLECDDYCCLDLKNGICVENDFIYDENVKIYYACKKTNDEGTACAECIEGYEVGKDGYCVDFSRCLEKENGECLRCTDEENSYGYSYCANKVFGCVESSYDNCLRCDDLLDIYSCTECKVGYSPSFYGGCIENN